MAEKYNYIQKSFSNLKEISIPKFQRGLVWTQEKRRDLISTLHEGYPFGVILVATNNTKKNTKDETDNSNDVSNWQLLDGQQRLSTIIDYSKNSIKYWKPLNQVEYSVVRKKVDKIFIDKGIPTLVEKDFDALLNLSSVEFTQKMIDLKISDMEDVLNIQKGLQAIRQSVDDYVNLKTLEIPMIQFTGRSQDYAQVFENLNKGGVPLNKYEIYNAAWIDARITLSSDNENEKIILDNIIDYYKEIEKAGTFELSESADEIIEDNIVNLAEFGRALGQLVVSKLPALTSDNVVNEIGFGILGIATNTNNKDIGTLNSSENLEKIQSEYKDILLRVDNISQKLNDTFSILKLNLGHSKGGAKKQYTDGLSTVFKTLSYFADLWDLDDREITKHLINIPGYYVADYLDNTWGAHGDSRLTDYYPEVSKKNYSNPIDKDAFKIKFKDWVSENNNRKNGFSKQIKALLNIYGNYTYKKDKDVLEFTGQDDEFEHIIPKKRILGFDKNNYVNLNSIGNGMILPKYLNLDKQAKTIYEYEKTRKTKINESGLQDKAHYPTELEFKEQFKNLEENNFDAVNKYLMNRSMEFIEHFVEKVL